MPHFYHIYTDDKNYIRIKIAERRSRRQLMVPGQEGKGCSSILIKVTLKKNWYVLQFKYKLPPTPTSMELYT